MGARSDLIAGANHKIPLLPDLLGDRIGVGVDGDLPTDPIYQQFDLDIFERALSEVWAQPARRVPYFGRSNSHEERASRLRPGSVRVDNPS
jgi:hypothetical protein